ncbi:polysaccharide biosynthesis/export family protein [Halomonas sp. 328]|uniref:polysaccharide biosynthesis/export family protein n=1 Tax=Halomonas sp. 328 TaxID=2776704 RepID=UPI0018A6F809|nr:polysaccharide biosynthesis/export family protein [Halomonas sp. 328]MBF8223913.1 polysaccharide biosynthesis/export family protein [Halomonas sp. 328]
MKKVLQWVAPCSLVLALVAGAEAQTLGGAGYLSPEQAEPSREQARGQGEADEAARNRSVVRQPGVYGPLELSGDAQEAIPPFGADLFTGGFRGLRGDGLNPNYRVMPGDQVVLRLWGAIELDRVIPVDAQGNLFIPSIGPVAVEGVSHGELDNRVKRAVHSVYPDNVEVYTNLQGVQPIGVFVTGFVQSPGRYAGVPSDALLYFLDQADGIDDQLGSYRSVRVLRGDQEILRADLYDFLLTGELPRIQFQDGDTIVVDRRGDTITVGGDVRRAYHFELKGETLAGQTVLDLAPLQAGVSHALIRGSRDLGPTADYVELNDFSTTPLRDGDEVLFSADERSTNIVVQLEGSHLGPSRFVLPKDVTLHELLDNIPVEDYLADTQSVSLRRESVAQRQQESLEESLRRLETTYLSASSSTPEEAEIRVREAELVSQFVERAREIEPNGRLVVSRDDEIANIRLQDGDVITIPERSDAVLISGEVLVPQSVVFSPGERVRDYIERAGGFTTYADERMILVARANGEVRHASDVELRPGDEVLVLPKAPTKNLQLASTISQILFHIAVTTRVALDI